MDDALAVDHMVDGDDDGVADVAVVRVLVMPNVVENEGAPIDVVADGWVHAVDHCCSLLDHDGLGLPNSLLFDPCCVCCVDTYNNNV